MFAAQLIPDPWRPVVTDLAVLAPLVLALAAIAVGVARAQVRWVRHVVEEIIDARLGPLDARLAGIDRAVNHQPHGTPTLVAQVQGLAVAVADLTTAGWRRAERVEELARLVADLADEIRTSRDEEPPNE